MADQNNNPNDLDLNFEDNPDLNEMAEVEEQREAIAEYLNVKRNFGREFQRWNSLPAYMQNDRQRYENLSGVQKSCFWELCDLLHRYVDQFVGIENFGRVEIEWIWTWNVWFGAFLDMAEQMCSRNLFGGEGCWLSISNLNEKNEPTVRIIVDGVLFIKKVDDVVCVLKFGPNALTLNGRVSSHICNHAQCFNSKHLRVESAGAKEDRIGCINGARNLCPHTPDCFSVDLFGKPVPCRNQKVGSCRNPRECGCMLALKLKYEFDFNVNNVFNPEFRQEVNEHNLLQLYEHYIID